MLKVEHNNTFQDYENLVNYLNQCDYHYYVLNQSLIPDSEYDRLYSLLKNYEQKNGIVNSESPSSRIGYPVENTPFTKVNHQVKMYSLDNAYSVKDCLHFFSKAQSYLKESLDFVFFLEYKYDGLALELIYEDGVFKQAVTRGDGTIGEDVTHTVAMQRSLLRKLNLSQALLWLKEQGLFYSIPSILRIRGEMVMPKLFFKKLNEKQLKQGLDPLSNPRNAASGTIRQLDAQISSERYLVFIPYGLGCDLEEQETLKTQENIQKFLEVLGFFVIRGKRVFDPTMLEKIFLEENQNRKNLPFEVDGLVFKLNDLTLQTRLGYIAKYPRFAFAYKFPALEVSTIVEKITFSVGRTGVITPVAHVVPQEVGGVVVKNISLHNYQEIIRHDLHLYDEVLIRRAGDVIPELVSVNKEYRKNHVTQVVSQPTLCPSCGSTLVQEQVMLRCLNEFQCEAQILARYQYFVSKSGLNIIGLGEKIVEQLFKAQLIKDYSSFFQLKKEDLLNLEGFKEKKIAQLLYNIEKARTVSFERLLIALGIRHLGAVACSQLAKVCVSWEDFWKISKEELMKLDGFGEEMVTSFLEYREHPIKRQWIKNLERVLIIANNNISQESVIKTSLFGKNIVITGTLSKDRHSMKMWLESLGAFVQNTVTKKTDFVLVGENPGSKVKEAQRLKIPLISEAQLHEQLKLS